MAFISSVVPPPHRDDPAWWFLFQDTRLLVAVQHEAAQIPFIGDPAALALSVRRTQYLGTIDGQHCYAAELQDSTVDVPAGMELRTLRSLYECLPEDLFWIAGRAFQIVDWDRTHHYCGQCGHALESLPEERAKTCPQCHLTQYPRIAPAIIVAVLRDQHILLAHAPRFPEGLYSVIAGFVEPGETFEECVRREVREEVGIEVTDIRYFGNQPWPFPHSLMVGFTARYAGGELAVDNTEITDAGWFRVGTLPKIPGKISIARQL
ncbi:NAD(+) diphosphatase, partial [candidate division KSB3 bacterium]|nr:NAD(+) diphosphatase [candidate division KSB3 bacterium]MBD3327420.1 NAD(+) diphosphatase [candidate division KSB3 bacterium]